MGINKYIKIGDRIKKLRIDSKMTQQDVANLIGVPRSTYANYENNTREPKEEILESISKVFGVTAWDLIINPKDLEKETKEAENELNFLLNCGYKVKFYTNDEGELQAVDLLNIESNNCKSILIDEYREFISKLKDFVDFEFSRMKK